MSIDWYLVLDKSKFHVYVAFVGDGEQFRIDWHTNSTLEVSPFVEKEGETCISVGKGEWDQPSFEVAILELLERYKLFQFNCRTVSYLILTKIVGYKPDYIYQYFKENHILCGLEFGQCFSLDEIHHYILYRENEDNNNNNNKTL
jgi:hypothetical protein